MANDFKHWKRRSVALCSLALVASLSAGVFAACTPADDTTDDEEEEETVSQTDTQTIRNGNFEFYTESDVEDLDEKRVLINTPTNWSFTSGSPTSDSASGIINLAEWDYLATSGREFTSVDDAVAHWNDEGVTAYDRLKFYEDFEDEIDDLDEDSEAAQLFDDYSYSIDYADVEYLSNIEAPTVHEGAAEDETSVLMIHNRRTSDGVLGTGQYYTSSTTITLSAGTAAQVSFWVRTDDLTHYYEDDELLVENNAGAYVRVNQTVGGTTLDQMQIKNINTKGEWRQYTLYIRANSFATTTFTVVFGLGQGSTSNRLEYVNGFAFFDDLVCTTISDAAYEEATAQESCTIDSEADDKLFDATRLGADVTTFKLDLDASFGESDDLLIGADSVAITTDPDGDRPLVKYDGEYPDDYAAITTVAGLQAAAANNAYLQNIYDTDFADKFLFDGSADDATIIMLMSVSSAPYTATSESYKLAPGGHMILSFWAKTSEIGGTGASATLVDGDNRTAISAFDTTTVATTDIDDENKDIYNGWVHCFFFVSNETESEKEFTFEFSYGPTDVATATQTAYDDGYAAFTGFEVLTDVDEKYFDYASSATYTQVVSLAGDVDIDSRFDAPGVTSADIRETLAVPANFTGVPNASKSLVTGGVANTLPEGVYTGLLNSKYASAYRENADNAAWVNALTALSSADATGEEWWADIFGDYNEDGTAAYPRIANQPLVLLNTSESAVPSYGFLSDTFTISASSYQKISLRVKLSAGATATIYLMDTSDVKQGYNNPLAYGLPAVTFWYDDDGNIVTCDPSSEDFNPRTDVLFYLEENGLYTKAGTNDGRYYANLQNYEEDESRNKIAVDADGNTTIAYYYNGGSWYAYRTEVSANNYSYSTEVYDIYGSLSEEEKSCVRYDYTQTGATEAKITLVGTEETAGRWTEVSFYVATGNTAKDYRLEIWAGSREFDVAADGTVTQTGTQIPAGSYFFFDSYSSTDVADDYSTLLDEKIDDLKEDSNNLVDPEDPTSNLIDSLAGYYTFTFYDAPDYLRYDATEDEEELGNPYGSYTQSSYSEAVAWLNYSADGETSLFINYAASEVTVEQDDLNDSTTEDDTTTDNTTVSETNIWLIISSAILAIALVAVAILIIIRRVVEKVRKSKAAKIKPVAAPRPRPVRKAEKTEKQESQPAPRDEDDPYNE